MSLISYQRALADLVASPDLCRKARTDTTLLVRKYSLTAREQSRLHVAIAQPGFSVCCSLHRANRLGPLNGVLPLTCAALGASLRDEVELFWGNRRPQDLQFKGEAERFGAFLLERLQRGQLRNLVVADILPFELAAAKLRLGPRSTGQFASPSSREKLCLHPLARILRFRYDPIPLIVALSAKSMPLDDGSSGSFWILLDGRSDELSLRIIEPVWAGILTTLESTGAAGFTTEQIDDLIASGLVVKAPLSEQQVRS